MLKGVGYEITRFPGCTTDIDEYLEWHKKRTTDWYREDHDTILSRNTCKAFGLTFRLESAKTEIIANLQRFLGLSELKRFLSEKLGVNESNSAFSGGIQKNLDGYEISPHPDVRQKRLYFIANIHPNPAPDLEAYGTHYMSFKNRYKYI